MHIEKQKGVSNLKIAFWSNLHGQNGTTSNMLAASIMSVLLYNSKVFLGQSHYNINNLESPLIAVSQKDKKEYFMNMGIDAMVRSIKSTYLDEEIIDNCTLSYMNKKLILLPTSVKNNYKIYEDDLEKTIISILQATNKHHDKVFIDLNTRENVVTKKIIEDIDLLVVNLSQNLLVLNDYEETFLNKYKDNKVIYIFGNYNCNSRYSLINLRKSYSWLKPNNSYVIPYNTEFSDSMSDGKIIPFFYKNLNIKKQDPNYYFIKEVKKLTKVIEEFMQLKVATNGL